MTQVFTFMITANAYESELKIEDCKLKICGCRFALSFLKWKEFLNSSIENLQFYTIGKLA
jgi:hypothetical protein